MGFAATRPALRHARALRALGLAAALACGTLGLGVLGGCASVLDQGTEQTQALLGAPPSGLPRRLHLAYTPFFPQTELQCGPAVLASLLSAAGRSETPETLSPELFVPGRGGTLQVELLAAARRHDAIGTQLPPSLQAVLTEVAAGHPVGVMQNLGLSFAPVWHFAVVVGFDLDTQDVILHSGQARDQRMSLQTFERTWARSERWAFVVLPPDTLPATATQAAVREGRLGFARTAPPARAATAWRAAAERWPDDVVLGMGLGNSLMQASQPRAAAEAFARLAEATDHAAAWNNLASVRLQLGERDAAREAARRAVLRAAVAEPDLLRTAQDTLAEAHTPPPR